MAKPIKNYTSSISSSRSITFIESQLIKHGAHQILKTYDSDGRVASLCFMIKIEGRDMPFKLPARVEECEKVLRANLTSRARPETRRKIPEQAERTAWKILSDWVEAQMALIQLSQVEILEVFLPYVFDSTKDMTFFETLKERKYKGLLPSAVD